MPVGTCPLCLDSKDLVESHLAPKAMYKYAADPTDKNPVTMVVSRGRKDKVTRQVKQYLLCSYCDNSFSTDGENYVMKLVWNGKRFPLLDRLNVAMEFRRLPDYWVYSGSAIGIDTEKLAYFALSVIWRASVCDWKVSKKETHRIDLGPHQETLRRYLRGETSFPGDVTVMATVCTDIYSRSFYMPSIATFPLPVAVPAFSFLAVGIHFLVLLGPFAPEQICCVRSPEKRIVRRDCAKKVLEGYAELLK